MSVDVFGRNLKRNEGSRGPPGIGFNITADGQYDMENKRLCNLASPIQSNEAVNLGTLQDMFATEIDKVFKVFASAVMTDKNNVEEFIKFHRDEINKKLLILEKEIRIIKDIALATSNSS